MNEFRVINTFIEEKIDCPKLKIKEFKKNDIITSFIENRRELCVLLSGEAELIRSDFNGDETVLEHFLEDTIFGELFYSITSNTQLNVMAKEDCKVLFIPYNFFEKDCNKNCKCHDLLIEKLISLISKRMINLTDHIEILTKKSIREKLLSYFSSLSYHKSSKTFRIPFSLTALADYLNIDRSAMMREMKYLKEEGFIKREKNKITLLFNERR